MRSYIEVIKIWESFLSKNAEGSIEEFGEYILESFSKVPKEKGSNDLLERYFKQTNKEHDYSDYNSEASYLIWRINKFSKGYVKELFDRLEINSHDEFAILSHVDYLTECRKKTAVKENLIDMSTGIDIIRRLINKGFLLERKNPDDKRENLIQLSKKGKKKLTQIYNGFSSVQDILTQITSEEKKELVRILKKLDLVHTSKLKK